MGQCFAIPLPLSKALSNMLITLTLPMTDVKDEVKSVMAVTTPLILVKNKVKYDRYTFTTLVNGVKGLQKPTPNRRVCRVWELF